MTIFPESETVWVFPTSGESPISVTYFVHPEQKIRDLYSTYNRADPDDENSFEIFGLVALEEFYSWIKTLPAFRDGDDDQLSSYVIQGEVANKVVAPVSLEDRLAVIFKERTKEDPEDEQGMYNLSFCAGHDLISWLRKQGAAIAAKKPPEMDSTHLREENAVDVQS